MGVYHLTQEDPEKDVMLFYQTHDGGDHWKQVGRPPVETWGKNLDYNFLEDGTGWLVVEKRIFITKDWAKTWNEIKTSVPLWEDKEEGDVFQVKFVNHKIGWIFVPFEINKLLQTVDGGQTWKQVF